MSKWNCFECGEDGHYAANCPNRQPRTRQQLPQHRTCPTCHTTVYAWDDQPCGSHAVPGAPDSRPEKEHIDAVIASAR